MKPEKAPVASNRYNQQFKREMERLIREQPNHPLKFLLGDHGQLLSAHNGKRTMFNTEDGVIQEVSIGQSDFVSASEYGEFLQQTGSVSISVDACHVTCKRFGGTTLALGIAERNKSDGAIEKRVIIENDVVDILGVPVLRLHADEWAERGLIDAAYLSAAPPSAGWTPTTPTSSTSGGNIDWNSLKLLNEQEAALRLPSFDRFGSSGE